MPVQLEQREVDRQVNDAVTEILEPKPDEDDYCPICREPYAEDPDAPTHITECGHRAHIEVNPHEPPLPLSCPRG